MIGNPAIARLLMEQGADARATTDSGKTALELAEESKHSEVASLLREASPSRSQGSALG